MKEFHRRDFANRTGLAQAWTVKSADRLFTLSLLGMSLVLFVSLSLFHLDFMSVVIAYFMLWIV